MAIVGSNEGRTDKGREERTANLSQALCGKLRLTTEGPSFLAGLMPMLKTASLQVIKRAREIDVPAPVQPTDAKWPTKRASPILSIQGVRHIDKFEVRADARHGG